MTPNTYCEQKLSQSGSNFAFSFIFLDPAQKQAMTALYAFCREVDDIVDSVNELEVAKAKLMWWKTEINNAFLQKANHPIARAIQESLSTYPLEKSYFIDIIQGMEMDLYKTTYATFEELKQYCYYAAGTVGLLSIEIMGYREENKESMQVYAKKLGIALQLTNILRDIKEDKERQRIYLPQEELLKFNLSSDDLVIDSELDSVKHAQLQQLFSFQAARATNYYQTAYTAIKNEDRHHQRMGLMMAAVYEKILEKIKRKHFPVLAHRVRLNPFSKIWVIWKTARREERYKNV